jgi:hypothetical protein
LRSNEIWISNFVDKNFSKFFCSFLSLSAGDCVLDKEMKYEVLDWTYLSQNSDLWRALVSTTINMSDLLNSENFVTAWATISFSMTPCPFSVQNIVFRIIITIRDWHICGQLYFDDSCLLRYDALSIYSYRLFPEACYFHLHNISNRNIRLLYLK